MHGGGRPELSAVDAPSMEVILRKQRTGMTSPVRSMSEGLVRKTKLLLEHFFASPMRLALMLQQWPAAGFCEAHGSCVARREYYLSRPPPMSPGMRPATAMLWMCSWRVP